MIEQNQLDVIAANDLFEGNYAAISKGAKEIVLGGTSDRLVHLESYLDGALGCPPSRRDSSHVDPEVCLEMEELLGNQAITVGDRIATAIFVFPARASAATCSTV